MKKVFIAATRQNDGKTIVSLGLLASFKERFLEVGYIKPVGQQYLQIKEHKIDKDAVLMHDTYNLPDKYEDMSPVAVPRGFTSNYILNGNKKELEDKILKAYTNVSKSKEIMLIEGTGHAGVGSVFDLGNAEVAKLLKAKVILVTCGGIGKPIDEIMLNKARFDSLGIEILGVITNKVLPEKYDRVNDIVRKGFAKKGLEVFGVIPYQKTLSSPTMAQLLEDMHGKLISGKKGLNNVVNDIIIGAMPPHEALNYFCAGTLLITPGSREDLILAALSGYVAGEGKDYSIAGIVLSGKTIPHKTILKLVKKTDIPIIAVEEDTFTVASYIHDLIVKIRATDIEKIKATEKLVKEYVDIDRIISRLNT
ncbi:MAG: AAA family ATPase [Candidatus Saganbacteria bacterium]|nr:AAA family ATPase [Candidatus Saganbacteria bacterium]